VVDLLGWLRKKLHLRDNGVSAEALVTEATGAASNPVGKSAASAMTAGAAGVKGTKVTP
jgi:hypothetical protein